MKKVGILNKISLKNAFTSLRSLLELKNPTYYKRIDLDMYHA